MTTNRDDGIRDLVRQAYEAASEPGQFDAQQGLREVLERASQPVKAVMAEQAVGQRAQAVGGNQVSTHTTQTLPRPVPTSDTDIRPVPGTIITRTFAGAFAVPPREGRMVLVGRNSDEVHVPLGVDDLRVSREHGQLAYQAGRWWLSNIGHSPIQLAGSRLLFNGEEAVPLPDGYTSFFVTGSQGRIHVVEVYIVGPDQELPQARPDEVTVPPATWLLSTVEKLVLVVVGQRYLLHEAHPRPLTWQQAAVQLTELDTSRPWTARRVEHVVTRVRQRLSASGVAGLTREEVGQPVGDSLRHNLIDALVRSTTLVPLDLHLLDELGEDPE
jgi:hypothetical protein